MKTFKEWLETKDKENLDVNESNKLDYGKVIQFLVENLKDPKSEEAKEVLNYIGKNLK